MNPISEASIRHSVSLGLSAEQVAQRSVVSRKSGNGALRLDLTGVVDKESMARSVSRQLLFPYGTHDRDVVIDLASDLFWFGHDDGYYLNVFGLYDIPPAAAVSFVEMLPDVVDRWRGQGIGFEVQLVGSDPPDFVATALARANQELAAFAALPWSVPGTGPVPVFNHTERDSTPRHVEQPVVTEPTKSSSADVDPAPPVIRFELGDLDLFASVRAAEEKCDVSDVRAHRYLFMDASGRDLRATVDDDGASVHLRVDGGSAADLKMLAGLLRRYVERGMPGDGWFDDPEAASPEQLIAGITRHQGLTDPGADHGRPGRVRGLIRSLVGRGGNHR